MWTCTVDALKAGNRPETPMEEMQFLASITVRKKRGSWQRQLRVEHGRRLLPPGWLPLRHIAIAERASEIPKNSGIPEFRNLRGHV